MKIIPINAPKIIMSNPTGKHNYFAWPTAARLKNGKLAVVASGFGSVIYVRLGKP